MHHYHHTTTNDFMVRILSNDFTINYVDRWCLSCSISLSWDSLDGLRSLPMQLVDCWWWWCIYCTGIVLLCYPPDLLLLLMFVISYHRYSADLFFSHTYRPFTLSFSLSHTHFLSTFHIHSSIIIRLW